MKTSKTALYRHFNVAGELLYVGISNSSIARFSQHKYQSAWFEDVVRMETEWFATREEAKQAEKIAINTEKPMFNINHNQRPHQMPINISLNKFDELASRENNGSFYFKIEKIEEFKKLMVFAKKYSLPYTLCFSKKSI